MGTGPAEMARPFVSQAFRIVVAMFLSGPLLGVMAAGSGPTISNVAVTATTTSASVTWTTDVAATSQVDYGLTTKYGITVNDATLVTSHSMTLSSLSCGTVYHYDQFQWKIV
jgi:hypothetical protein